MGESVAAFTAYDVSFDAASVMGWDLGPDGTGYAVQLAGPVDDRWARSYYLTRLGSASFARFHLDSERKIVWFACRSGDAPMKIQPVLDSLQKLIRSANASAEEEAWDSWGESPSQWSEARPEKT